MPALTDASFSVAANSPEGAKVKGTADGYGYDVRVNPKKNVMLTSSFTGWNNYMMDFGKMLKDEEALTDAKASVG